MLHDLFSVFAIFTFLEPWLVFIKGPLIYARILYWNRRILHFSVLVTWLDVCQNNAILLLFFYNRVWILLYSKHFFSSKDGHPRIFEIV